jgi:hypothetical protein
MERIVDVVGHRNPDTDSVCSAIAYANLKQCLGEQNVRPARAGPIDAETAFVLQSFDVPVPECARWRPRSPRRAPSLRSTTGSARVCRTFMCTSFHDAGRTGYAVSSGRGTRTIATTRPRRWPRKSARAWPRSQTRIVTGAPGLEVAQGPKGPSQRPWDQRTARSTFGGSKARKTMRWGRGSPSSHARPPLSSSSHVPPPEPPATRSSISSPSHG